jgi:hypothetical protein
MDSHLGCAALAHIATFSVGEVHVATSHTVPVTSFAIVRTCKQNRSLLRHEVEAALFKTQQHTMCVDLKTCYIEN